MAKAIDVHTHVFNLKYLPVAAILNHSGLADLPRFVADAVGSLALAMTKADPTLDAPVGLERSAPAAARAETEAEASAEEDAQEMEQALEDFDSYLAEKDRTLPDAVRGQPAVRSALAEAPGFAMRGAADQFTLRGIVALAERFVADARQKLQWVFAVATQTERSIVKLMLKTYGNEVDIFVHHMMNMASFYRDGRTQYEYYPRQIDRMRRLGEAHPGRLIAFTAWDPFRDEPDQLEAVKDAVQNRGARGVKVYPPSGYRAVGNAGDNRHPRVASPAPAEIDSRNLELFHWCASQGIPVFTHCTDKGFEAFEGAGALNASPLYWRRLLETKGLAELKLCLGHAGGEAWFGSDAEFGRSFAAEVVRLCTDARFPNVCCEFGILDHVRDEADFRTVRDRLGAIVNRHPAFAGRILYGSDWHMLYMRRGHEDFFRHYERLFAEPALRPHRDAFFRHNAERYLGLPA